MFNKGRGVAQSDVKATQWFRKTADQVHAQAQNDMGILLAL
jgi:TPR repeat protein